MTIQRDSDARSLVLFPIRKKRFAVRSEVLRELAPPVRLHKFPQTSPGIIGVIVRRGQIIPVYDAGNLLVGRPSTIHRFYLVVQFRAEDAGDLAAIPVDGECELATAAVENVNEERPFVSGVATIGGESVPVLDLATLFTGSSADVETPTHAEVHS